MKNREHVDVLTVKKHMKNISLKSYLKIHVVYYYFLESYQAVHRYIFCVCYEVTI